MYRLNKLAFLLASCFTKPKPKPPQTNDRN
jgi:hypothetical protein